MKIIAIGDTHGRQFWKFIANTKKFDKLVFIGDYFDSFDISVKDQVNNFLDICAYKVAHPDKVVLLIGNHDYHYMPAALEIGEVYSGFNAQASPLIKQVLEDNKHLLQAAYQHEDWLFTHAGVTATWGEFYLKPLQELMKTEKKEYNTADYINLLFQFKPSAFFFVGRDPYGNSKESSPIWVRPESLMENPYETPLKQVVGHTGQAVMTVKKDRFFFIDTLGYSREYLIIEDGQYHTETC